MKSTEIKPDFSINNKFRNKSFKEDDVNKKENLDVNRDVKMKTNNLIKEIRDKIILKKIRSCDNLNKISEQTDEKFIY